MVDKKALCRQFGHSWSREAEVIDGREISQLVCHRCSESGPAHVNKILILRREQEGGDDGKSIDSD